jgi:S-formylglutathione hydrolase
LGDNPADWKNYDASELLKTTRFKGEILVDQGTEDKFLKEQLMPEKLESRVKIRMQSGYDHSYYFVSSFIEDHLRFHHRAMMPTGLAN